MTDTLHIVFDGPPSPEGPRFIEVETPDGRSINAGEWCERPDERWQLVIKRPSEANQIGAAELQVGQAVYQRIEKLIGAAPGTPEARELSYLSHLAESVEELGGYDGPMTDTTAGEGVDKDLLHDAIRQLRQHASTIQAAKRASKSGEAQGMAPIWNLINALPGIIRQLDSAEFERDAAFEQHEARPLAAQPSAGARGEAVAVPRLQMKMALANAIWSLDRNATTDARVEMCKAQDILTGAIPAQPDTGDVAALREALATVDAMARSGAAMSAANYSVSAEKLGESIYKVTTPILAALSKPNAQGTDK